uniref:Enhancer of rudimentary homolog n=1 Tax=Graphocephala atropunctata TaxID=36148 RepID=A0A1B6MR03_9HEMI
MYNSSIPIVANPRQSHCILLVQVGSLATRTFLEYESVTDCILGISKVYEEYLGVAHPLTPQITYNASQLLKFIEDVPDMSCLVYQQASNMYVPYNKLWIMEKVLNHFKRTIGPENIT